MKKVTVIVESYWLKDIVGKTEEIIDNTGKLRKIVNLYLYDKTNFFHVLKTIDTYTRRKFPVKGHLEYGSFLHMIWNPTKKRIYRHIATSLYTKDDKLFGVNVKEKPHAVLPDWLKIYLGVGLCNEPEKVISCQKFQKAMSKQESI